mmetsp:Transcript_102564/g.313632  ORF Transcript_102564/g.313632 Transcript_102564/m.313632 type:complete len:269 (-) Transcript_102564:366-1172(-)
MVALKHGCQAERTLLRTRTSICESLTCIFTWAGCSVLRKSILLHEADTSESRDTSEEPSPLMNPTWGFREPSRAAVVNTTPNPLNLALEPSSVIPWACMPASHDSACTGRLSLNVEATSSARYQIPNPWSLGTLVTSAAPAIWKLTTIEHFVVLTGNLFHTNPVRPATPGCKIRCSFPKMDAPLTRQSSIEESEWCGMGIALRISISERLFRRFSIRRMRMSISCSLASFLPGMSMMSMSSAAARCRQNLSMSSSSSSSWWDGRRRAR